MTTEASESYYAPTAEHVLHDPAAAYARLRAGCPVHLHEGLENPLHTLARTEHILQVLADTDTWSNRKGPGISKSLMSVGDVQRDDPPEHTRRRKFLHDPFLPRAVATLEPQLRTVADGLAAGLAPHCVANIYCDYALPLPVTAFCLMMGIDIEARDQFSHWADEMVMAMTYPERGVEARRAINAFSRSEIQRRRDAVVNSEPVADGFLTHLANSEYADGAPMELREAANTVSQLLVAGHETTTSLITNLAWRLLEDRTRWERLLADPALIPNAVEESLRFDPPVLGLCRTNNTVTTIGGVVLEEDSKVMILYASACRDPELFDAPDEFRVDRPLLSTKRHLAFSWGIHHCLGAHLARLTARVALETLLTRFPTMHLTGPTERIAAPFLWGRKHVPVAWS